MKYELHPLCTLFLRLTGAGFKGLRDGIKTNERVNRELFMKSSRNAISSYRALLCHGVTGNF
ncbi:hypothetical protein SAMN05428978_103317 [Nitrosomonas sp. Nm34]|nr:hypothetical protein SAMN05428978_103317 [Nitrosomonas sp. Nm34]